MAHEGEPDGQHDQIRENAQAQAWSRRKRGLSAARHTSSRARPDRPQLGFGEPEMWSWRIALRAGPILIASSARICRGEDLRAWTRVLTEYRVGLPTGPGGP